MSSLYEQLQEKLGGRPYNGYFACLCQFHDDHSPSMFVFEDGYSCKSCGARGSLEKLNRHLGGRSVKVPNKTSLVLPKWREWEQKWGDLEGIAKHAHQTCIKRPSEMWYLKDRKIDQFFELGCFGMIDYWCLFPVFDAQHKIQNIVVRHTKRKDVRYAIKHTDDNTPLLYCPNYDRVKNSEVVYVPFGIVDSWSFEAIGLASVTGITGKSLSAELLQTLGKRIVLVPDEGEEREAHMIANKLGWRCSVKRLKYDDGCKDVDDVRITMGNNYLLQAVS